MSTKTLRISEESLRRLSDEAARCGVSEEDLAVQILEAHAAEFAAKSSQSDKPVLPRKFESLGSFDSGRSDISELASDMRNFYREPPAS